ncbi:MAG: hypothetical protein U9Q27_03550 [Patescibacteria group bacterium]|nr:hypothetical protein [Patescibacteria group bacterium]
MKQLPTVKCRKNRIENKTNYKFRNFNMAWVSDPVLERRQATGVTFCREELCTYVRASIYGDSYYSYLLNDKDLPIDMNRTRLLILNDGTDRLKKQQFKENLFNGKALLNVYEKIGNFSNLSKISTINHENYGKQWLITGPKEWMKSGQLISAMTFLLRLATFNGPIDTSSLKTVETSFKKLLDNKNRINYSIYGIDIDQSLRCFWDKIWVLVKFQNELFSNNYEENYKVSLIDDKDPLKKIYLSHNTFGKNCGIRNLAKKTSKLSGDIDEKFAKLCEKYLPRIET